MKADTYHSSSIGKIGLVAADPCVAAFAQKEAMVTFTRGPNLPFRDNQLVPLKYGRSLQVRRRTLLDDGNADTPAFCLLPMPM